jgi:GNAT superfamily N-acetyltransferase
MKNSNVQIRIAATGDADLLSQLGARAFADTFAADNTPENMDAYLRASFSPEKQAAELAEPASLFLIAEIDHIPVGYARLRASDAPAEIKEPRPVEIERIYAVKDYIGKGIGSALMAACLDEAAARNYQTVWLGVWERNLRAIAFYQKWGFITVGAHVFQLGSETQSDLLMARPAHLPVIN